MRYAAFKLNDSGFVSGVKTEIRGIGLAVMSFSVINVVFLLRFVFGLLQINYKFDYGLETPRSRCELTRKRSMADK